MTAVTPQRRWLALAAATVVVTFAFWALAYGATVLDRGVVPSGARTNTESIGLLAIALGVSSIPIAFLVVALLSRRPDWPIGVLAAMGLSLTVGLPLLVFNNPLGSLLAGTAAGAVVAVQREPGTTWHNRAIAAAIVALVAVVGMQVDALFPLIAIVGPALPFTAVGIADRYTTSPLSDLLNSSSDATVG